MNIQTGTFVAVIIGLVSGIAIGIQGTINSIAGKAIGSIPTGLLVNFMGGVLSAILVIMLIGTNKFVSLGDVKGNLSLLTISGALGIGIIVGIAYSLPRIGVSAGLAVIISGQMLTAVLADSFGWGGSGIISITPIRLIGLFLLFIGTWCLLPKN